MKTLFILASTMAVLFLAAPSRIEAQKARANTAGKQSVSVAQPGFYITLSRANCCGRVKPDSALSFRSRGYSAFFGDPHYPDSSNLIESVDIVKYWEGGWNMLFVGPFQSESAAQSVVSKIPSILRKQIAEDRRYLSLNSYPRGTKFSPEETTGFYKVEVSKVLSVTSGKLFGDLARLLPEDFVIRPGVGVGRVLIGSSKSEVLSLLGNPVAGTNTWGAFSGPSGRSSLSVSYDGETVSRIDLTGSKFHTVGGLTAVSGRAAFLKTFPTTIKCHSQLITASAGYYYKYWDAASKGIALLEIGNIESPSTKPDRILIVHGINQPFEKEGECKH